jgi:16S rRNA (cytosine1402-N4)-methyltransferase
MIAKSLRKLLTQLKRYTKTKTTKKQKVGCWIGDLAKTKSMKDTHQKNQNKHTSVLLSEVLEYLAPQEGNSYLDVTAGYGGHAAAVLDRTKAPSKATLVDRDQNSIKHLEEVFPEKDVEIIRNDYLNASKELLEQGRKYNLILADLGVSSPHLNEASRGFSFQTEGPLDMRMDQSQDLSASTIVNKYSEDKLAKILKEYGEEPKAHKIANLIVSNRPITNTIKLAQIIKRAWPGHSKVHPATRTFQAIRLAVNEELEQLQEALPIWVDLLEPNGRIVIISFHSLEDRIVKNFFKEISGDLYDSTIKLLTKSPVVADQNEIVTNPRARSAKLRAAVK